MNEEQRARILACRAAWQRAREAYEAEAASYFVAEDATKPVAEQSGVPDKGLDAAARERLNVLHETTARALDAWHRALSAVISG